MIFLRFILVFVLVIYLIRILMRWIIGQSSRQSARAGKKQRTKTGDYRVLTDQEIEDAEYEEIESGDR